MIFWLAFMIVSLHSIYFLIVQDKTTISKGAGFLPICHIWVDSHSCFSIRKTFG